jgi:hypothetical protein
MQISASSGSLGIYSRPADCAGLQAAGRNPWWQTRNGHSGDSERQLWSRLSVGLGLRPLGQFWDSAVVTLRDIK